MTDLIVSVLASGVATFWPSREFALFDWLTGQDLQNVMLALSASAWTMVGFVLAASTFLLSHTGHDRFAVLRASKGFKQLIDIVKSTMWRLISLGVFTALASLVDHKFQIPAAAGVTFLATYALLGICCLTWCTLAIVEIPTD